MHTILLIEDNFSNISILEDIFLFDDIPARLVSVESGEEGLNRAIELQPALILWTCACRGSTASRPPGAS